MKGLNIFLALLLGLWSGLPAPAAFDRRTPVVVAVEKALPSVVNIGTERIVKVVYRDPFFNLRSLAHGGFIPRDLPLPPPVTRERRQYSVGSGIVVDPAGYLLTNYHVIEQTSRVRVMLGDQEIYEATLLAGDPLNDLALLKIDPTHPLQAIAFAADDDLLLGETVIALGNPYGFSQTVTVGVLSGINREARYEDRVVYRDILQTDAAVNPGNSGGPLVNINGELIGVNVQVLQPAQNIGFAVPVKRARALLARWLSPRVLRKMWIGFEPSWTNGVLRVGSAPQDLLPAGAEIRAVDGKPVADLLDFNQAVLAHQIGDQVTLTVRTNEEDREATLGVAALPKVSGEQLARQTLGLVLSDTTPDQAVKAGFRNGLGIKGVLADGAAERSKLRPGLLLTRIDETEIRTLDDVAEALENVLAGQKVTLKLVNLVEEDEYIVAEVAYWDVVAN